MYIIIIAISMGLLLSLLMACLILLCVQYNYYQGNLLNGRNNQNILPIRNIPNVTVKPKKEIELIPMKKYVFIQNPDQQISIGIGYNK